MPSPVPGIEIEKGAVATMRDGCRLVSDIYRPAGQESVPVLVLRIPYDRRKPTQTNFAHPAWYARQGFMVVVQDTRGRFGSEGDFEPFVHEADDGYDTVEWAAQLPGSNGRVGTYGASYAGYSQLLTAATQPPSLRAICPVQAPADLAEHWFYEGGAFSLAMSAFWAALLGIDAARRARRTDLEARLLSALGAAASWYGSASPYELEPIATEVPYYREWLEHAPGDPYWSERGMAARYDRISVPALHVGSWYDVFTSGTIQNFTVLSRAHGNQELLMGPWTHVPWGRVVGAVDFGSHAQGRVVDRAIVSFLRRHLLPDEGHGRSTSPVRYFVLFENGWRESITWPPTDAGSETWYLHSEGLANSSGGDGRLDRRAPEDEPCDVYVYDPSDPVPSIGGHSCCTEGQQPMGAADQRKVEERMDVLVYTSAPLGEDLVLTGPVGLDLWVTTDAPDADYTATLCVVDEGSSVNVAEGVVRATAPMAHRSEQRPIRLTVNLREVACRVRMGQRLRLDVSSGSFPMYDINPQSGVAPARATVRDTVPRSHCIFHQGVAASRLTLTTLASSPRAPGAGTSGKNERGDAEDSRRR